MPRRHVGDLIEAGIALYQMADANDVTVGCCVTWTATQELPVSIVIVGHKQDWPLTANYVRTHEASEVIGPELRHCRRLTNQANQPRGVGCGNGPLLLPFAGGLFRVSWPVCVRPVIAYDRLHRTYGKRGAFLTTHGKRDGAQNHAILPVTETTSIRASTRAGVGLV
jgi:hypothetical protein